MATTYSTCDISHDKRCVLVHYYFPRYSTCAVSSTAVFCSPMMLCCSSALLRYFLNDFVILSVVPTINFIAVSSSSTLSPTFSLLSSSLLALHPTIKCVYSLSLLALRQTTEKQDIARFQTSKPTHLNFLLSPRYFTVCSKHVNTNTIG